MVIRELFVKIGLIDNSSDRLKDVQKEADKANDNFRKFGVNGQTSLEMMGRAVGLTSNEMEKLISKTKTDMKLEKDFKDAARAAGLAEEEISRVKNSIDRAKESAASWKGVMSGLASLGIGALAIGITKSLLSTGINFEAQMSQVAAATDASREDLQRMSEESRRLGASTVFSASEAAQAMTELGKAGMSTAQIMTGTNAVLDLAGAGGLGLAEATTIAADTMSGFGLKAEDMGRIADVMAKGANASTISVQMLGETFKYVSGVAKAANVSLEETAAMTAILGNAGIKASMAGTTLKAMLIQLASPSKQAASMLSTLGVKTADAAGNLRPMADIIGDLQISMKNFGNQKKIDYLSTIFGSEPAAGVIALIDKGKKGIQEMTELMQKAGGSAKAFAAKANDNVKGLLKSLSSILEEIQLKVFDVLGPMIKPILQFFTDSEKGMGRTVVVLTMLSAVIGVILVNATLAWAASLDAVTMASIRTYAALIGPAVILAAKILAVYLILEDIWTFFEYGPRQSETYFADLLKWMGLTKYDLLVLWDTMDDLKVMFLEAWENISEAFQNPAVRYALMGIAAVLLLILAPMAVLSLAVFALKAALVIGIVLVIAYIAAKWDELSEKFQTKTAQIKGWFLSAWESIKKGFNIMTDFLIDAAILSGKILISALFPIIGIYIFREEIKNAMTYLWNSITEMPFIQKIVEQFAGMKERIMNVLSGMWDSLKNVFVNLLPTDSINAVIDLINTMIGKLNDFTTNSVAQRLGITPLNLQMIPHIQAREFGGPIEAGVVTRVGERGPEDIITSQSGTVIPNGGNSQGSPVQISAVFNIQSAGESYDAETLWEKILGLVNSHNSKNQARVELGMRPA